jgi:hypothetical protein
MRVGDSIVVLGEASRCNEVVHLAVLLQNLGEGLVDRCWTGDIAVMCCDLGDTMPRVSRGQVYASGLVTSLIRGFPS